MSGTTGGQVISLGRSDMHDAIPVIPSRTKARRMAPGVRHTGQAGSARQERDIRESISPQ